MKYFQKFQRFMAAVMVFTMLFGCCPAWAEGANVTIDATTGAVSPNTWSGTAYVGVDGKALTIGANVINSIRTNGEATADVYGIRYTGNTTLTVGSLAGGIAVNSAVTYAYGIFANGAGKTTVSALSGIGATGNNSAYGIYSDGTGTGFENNVSFSGAGSYINATATGSDAGQYGYAYGIGAYQNGTTTVSNLGGITANGSANAIGILTNGSDSSFNTTVTFKGKGSNISATGKTAAAISVLGTAGNTTVSNLGDINVEGKNEATGIGAFGKGGNLSVSFAGKDSKILVSSTNEYAVGIGANATGTIEVTGLGKMSVNGKYDGVGIANNASKINVTFAEGSEGLIDIASGPLDDEEEEDPTAMGMILAGGETTVTGLNGISANASNGFAAAVVSGIRDWDGIESEAGASVNNSIEFNETNGGYINASGQIAAGVAVFGITPNKSGSEPVENEIYNTVSKVNYIQVTGTSTNSSGITGGAGIVSAISDVWYIDPNPEQQNTGPEIIDSYVNAANKISFTDGGYINASGSIVAGIGLLGAATNISGNSSSITNEISNLNYINAKGTGENISAGIGIISADLSDVAAFAAGLMTGKNVDAVGITNNISFADGGYVNASGKTAALGVGLAGVATNISGLDHIEASAKCGANPVPIKLLDEIPLNLPGVASVAVLSADLSNLPIAGLNSADTRVNTIRFSTQDGGYIKSEADLIALGVGTLGGGTNISNLKGIEVNASNSEYRKPIIDFQGISVNLSGLAATGILAADLSDMELELGLESNAGNVPIVRTNNYEFTGAGSYINATAEVVATGIAAIGGGTNVNNLGNINAVAGSNKKMPLYLPIPIGEGTEVNISDLSGMAGVGVLTVDPSNILQVPLVDKMLNQVLAERGIEIHANRNNPNKTNTITFATDDTSGYINATGKIALGVGAIGGGTNISNLKGINTVAENPLAKGEQVKEGYASIGILSLDVADLGQAVKQDEQPEANDEKKPVLKTNNYNFTGAGSYINATTGQYAGIAVAAIGDGTNISSIGRINAGSNSSYAGIGVISADLSNLPIKDVAVDNGKRNTITFDTTGENSGYINASGSLVALGVGTLGGGTDMYNLKGIEAVAHTDTPVVIEELGLNVSGIAATGILAADLWDIDDIPLDENNEEPTKRLPKSGNNYVFTGTGSYINARADVAATGIAAIGGGTNISGLGNISALAGTNTTKLPLNIAYQGISVNISDMSGLAGVGVASVDLSNVLPLIETVAQLPIKQRDYDVARTNTITFATDENSGYINAQGKTAAVGVMAIGGGTNISNLKGIDATASKSDDPVSVDIYVPEGVFGQEINISIEDASGIAGVGILSADLSDVWGLMPAEGDASVRVSKTNTVDFTDGGYINASGAHTGIGIASIGRATNVSGLGSINATGNYAGFGIVALDIPDMPKLMDEVSKEPAITENKIAFTGTGSYINATGSVIASGITFGFGTNGSTREITNLGGINATVTQSTNNAGITELLPASVSTGILSLGNLASKKITFAAGGSGIVATTPKTGEKYAAGIASVVDFGDTTIENVGGIKAESSADVAGILTAGGLPKDLTIPVIGYDIPAMASFNGKAMNVTVSFADGKDIKVSSAIEKAGAFGIHNGAYKVTDGVEFGGYGHLAVSNLGGITAAASGGTGENASKAIGIYSNGSSANISEEPELAAKETLMTTVNFADTNTGIKATSKTGDASGIYSEGIGKTEVTGLAEIYAEAARNSYGIFAESSDGEEVNVSVGKITAKAETNAIGINAVDAVKLTVTDLESIEATTTEDSEEARAIGIYTAAHENKNIDATINFKGKGGQAIKATAKHMTTAFSIFASGTGGTTTVNFENSILSGKIIQGGDSTLTLNFNDKGVWTPTATDISGKVNVNVNNGGTIDTRIRDAEGKVTTAGTKTIDLGAGTFTAEEGATISFDAETADTGFTTDQIKAASATGTIALGSVNVKDSATTEWTEAQTANLFDAATNTIAVTGTTNTDTALGWRYTFTGGANGNVSVTSKLLAYTLPQVIQAKPQEAGEADTFSFDSGDVTIKDDLGTLDNTYRASGKKEFTIYGNGNTLDANGKGGVTINAGDTMSVENTKIKGFTQFATNAGTLNLKDVKFNNTTTADVVNSGTLNLTGTNTFVKGIAGNGTTNINADTDMGSATLTQGNTNVADGVKLSVAMDKLNSAVTNNGTVNFTNGGTLGATIKGGEVYLGGDTTADIAKLLADDVYNADILTLTGKGTLNENIWDKDGVKGTVKMNASEITVAEHKTIESKIEYLGKEKANVELKDGSEIAGTVTAPEGSKIIVSGNDVTNEAYQNLDVIVKETKDLTTTKALAGNITLEKEAELTATEEGALLGDKSKGTEITVGEDAKLIALAGNINTDIYNASDHSVHLKGGKLTQNIYGIDGVEGTTYIEDDTEFANDITVKNKVYVDNGKTLSAANPFTLSNTLTFEGGDETSTIKNIATTGTLAFVLTGKNLDKAIVKAENGYNITGAKIALYQEDKALYNRLDVVKLMAGAEGSYANQLIKAQNEGDVILEHKYSTYLQGDELLAKYLGTGAAEETKSFSEGRLAGAAVITQSSDLLAGAGLASAIAAAQTSSNGYAPFIEIEGSHGKFNTGSHVNMNSFNVVAGLAKKVSESTTVGAYIEGGNGRYTSYNDFTTGELRADGQVNYFGAGIFGHYAFNKTDKGNAYVDGAFGAGHTSQDYATDSILLASARYDASSAYLKAHATFGYNFNIAKDAKIDAYAKYLWAHQNGDNPGLSTGEQIDFNAINSHRLRFGARYVKGIRKNISWYGGLAYEYEFGMSAGANSLGYDIAEPDLKGGSVMAELGLKFAPNAAKGWRFDAGLQGFTGKRDSLGVKLGAWYEF